MLASIGDADEILCIIILILHDSCALFVQYQMWYYNYLLIPGDTQ